MLLIIGTIKGLTREYNVGLTI